MPPALLQGEVPVGKAGRRSEFCFAAARPGDGAVLLYGGKAGKRSEFCFMAARPGDGAVLLYGGKAGRRSEFCGGYRLRKVWVARRVFIHALAFSAGVCYNTGKETPRRPGRAMI